MRHKFKFCNNVSSICQGYTVSLYDMCAVSKPDNIKNKSKLTIDDAMSVHSRLQFYNMLSVKKCTTSKAKKSNLTFPQRHCQLMFLFQFLLLWKSTKPKNPCTLHN